MGSCLNREAEWAPAEAGMLDVAPTVRILSFIDWVVGWIKLKGAVLGTPQK